MEFSSFIKPNLNKFPAILPMATAINSLLRKLTPSQLTMLLISICKLNKLVLCNLTREHHSFISGLRYVFATAAATRAVDSNAESLSSATDEATRIFDVDDSPAGDFSAAFKPATMHANGPHTPAFPRYYTQIGARL